MPSEGYLHRQVRVEKCRTALLRVIADTDEREIDIWIAALTTQLARLSDYRLQDDSDQARMPDEEKETA